MQRDLILQQRQVFLMEKDAGLICRVLGFYAARGIEIDELQYLHAAPQTMMLTVAATADAELLRVLVAKCASLVGVFEAVEQYKPGASSSQTAHHHGR